MAIKRPKNAILSVYRYRNDQNHPGNWLGWKKILKNFFENPDLKAQKWPYFVHSIFETWNLDKSTGNSGDLGLGVMRLLS